MDPVKPGLFLSRAFYFSQDSQSLLVDAAAIRVQDLLLTKKGIDWLGTGSKAVVLSINFILNNLKLHVKK